MRYTSLASLANVARRESSSAIRNRGKWRWVCAKTKLCGTQTLVQLFTKLEFNSDSPSLRCISRCLLLVAQQRTRAVWAPVCLHTLAAFLLTAPPNRTVYSERRCEANAVALLVRCVCASRVISAVQWSEAVLSLSLSRLALLLLRTELAVQASKFIDDDKLCALSLSPPFSKWIAFCFCLRHYVCCSLLLIQTLSLSLNNLLFSCNWHATRFNVSVINAIFKFTLLLAPKLLAELSLIDSVAALQDNFGVDLATVEASEKKHEAIETDILAYEERVQAVVAVSDELERENYHDKDRIVQRKEKVLTLWRYLRELLEKRGKRLALSLDLHRVFQDMLYLLDWIAEMQVRFLP